MKNRSHVWARPPGDFPKGARLQGSLSYPEMVELYQQGHTIREIAKKDGTVKTVVWRALQKAGVIMRPRHRPRLYDYKHLADQLGCSPAVVLRFQVLAKLGAVCCKCGENDLRVLQINHIDGKQRKLTISELQAIAAGQVKNVDVRCANCNVRYEYERGFRPWFASLNQYLALPKNG